MARKASSKQVRVFINCPFDWQYEKQFLALISGIVCVGLEPHSVLEHPADQMRLERLINLISSCGASLHDLSRTTLSGRAGQRVPRFNMPFELGIACQESFRSGGKHSFFILEEVPFRLQRSMSDLNAYDPLIHHGEVRGVLRCVVNALGTASGMPTPSMNAMESVTEGVIRVMRLKKRRRELETLFDRNGFQSAVLAATELARATGLVPG